MHKLRTIALLALIAGFAGGLVVMGRLSPQTSGAEPVAVSPQSRTSAEPPTAAISPSGVALPNLSDVAERAIQASVNISSTQYKQVDPFFQMFYRRSMVVPET